MKWSEMSGPLGSHSKASSHNQMSGLPSWLLGLLPLAVIGAAITVFVLAGGPGLGERTGPPVEDLVVEKTILTPGQIKLVVRNDGPDPVDVKQIAVNDGYVQFSADKTSVPRLGKIVFEIAYSWVNGESYEIFLLTNTGGTIDHQIDAASETPSTDLGFFGLMALLGLYVGIIPVSIGMLWLPFIRRIRDHWFKFLMSVTIGLLGFLAFDAALEGISIGEQAPSVFGGVLLVGLGAAAAYLALVAIDVYLRRRRERTHKAGASGIYLALLVAIGIGLHNLGEGLAIGAAYSVGALALGTSLVVGFAIHNTTEGFAIVSPTADRAPSLAKLVGLGLIAGTPAIVGAWIGAASLNNSLSAFLLGAGVGAIVQVIQQLAPLIRDPDGRHLYPTSVLGITVGIVVLYTIGLLVSN